MESRSTHNNYRHVGEEGVAGRPQCTLESGIYLIKVSKMNFERTHPPLSAAWDTLR